MRPEFTKARCRKHRSLYVHHCMTQVEASLTGDALVYMHIADEKTPIERTMEALAELKA